MRCRYTVSGLKWCLIKLEKVIISCCFQCSWLLPIVHCLKLDFQNSYKYIPVFAAGLRIIWSNPRVRFYGCTVPIELSQLPKVTTSSFSTSHSLFIRKLEFGTFVFSFLRLEGDCQRFRKLWPPSGTPSVLIMQRDVQVDCLWMFCKWAQSRFRANCICHTRAQVEAHIDINTFSNPIFVANLLLFMLKAHVRSLDRHYVH